MKKIVSKIVSKNVMKGVVIKNTKNDDGTYDGLISSNGNKYYYFGINQGFDIDTLCEFNMSTTDKDFCDFEAVNIKKQRVIKNCVVNDRVMKGMIIENTKNEDGKCDGIIKTSNGNKYHYFGADGNFRNFNINTPCEFNMSTTDNDFCDFEAVNIKTGRVINNRVMNGIIIENTKNKDDTYDGVIKTINGNKYHYFGIDKSFDINTSCEFNVSTTTKYLCEFEAVNIKI